MVIAFFISLVALYSTSHSVAKPIVEAEIGSLDSAIPSDSVLIPIKVQNETSLDGVFEEVGFVDLYSAPEDERKKSEKVISGVKMIRSPHQRDQFSVIVKSKEAAQVIRFRGQFLVTLQSRDHHKADMPNPITKRLITVGNK